MPQPTPVEVLAAASPETAAAFQALRKAVSSGGLDEATEELTVISALAARSQLRSLSVHVRRALASGTPVERVRAAIIAPLGAASLFGEVVAALRVVNEVAERQPTAPAQGASGHMAGGARWPRTPAMELSTPLGASLFAKGQPRAVVLLHSLALDRCLWLPTVDVLAASFSVLACDLPGHGRSPRAPEPTVEAMADGVASLMESAAVTSAVVIGMSLGGSVALALAVRHPEKVAGLGLVDTTAYYGENARAQWAERSERAARDGFGAMSDFQLDRWFSDDFRARRPEACEAVLATFAATGLEGYQDACAAFGAMDLRDAARGLSCPAAVVVGEQDYATPVQHARDLHERIDGSTLTILPGCRHLSAVERPLSVLGAFGRLLDR